MVKLTRQEALALGVNCSQLLDSEPFCKVVEITKDSLIERSFSSGLSEKEVREECHYLYKALEELVGYMRDIAAAAQRELSEDEDE